MSKLELLARKLNYNIPIIASADSNKNNVSAKLSNKNITSSISDSNKANSKDLKAPEPNNININNNNNNNKVLLNDASNNTKLDESTFKMANIEPNYEYKGYHRFKRILGKGSFGTVIECERIKDGKLVALKFFKYKAIHKWVNESVVLSDLDDEVISKSEFFSRENITINQERPRMLPMEVACLARANKLNGVVKLLDYIPATSNESNPSCQAACDGKSQCCSSSTANQDANIDEDSIIGIVLERDQNEICLFDYLIQNDFLSEKEARVIIKQIVETSLVLLQNGILHGDLKSENILIDPNTKRIKLIDFGSAQILDPNINQTNSSANKHDRKFSLQKCNSQSLLAKPVRTFRGTNLYKPPEYLLHHCFYPRPSTVWTFGIILFDMVCGHFPFDNDSDVLIHQDKDILFKRSDLTDDFKDLVRKCLAFYVAERIVIEKILEHPWMTKISN